MFDSVKKKLSFQKPKQKPNERLSRFVSALHVFSFQISSFPKYLKLMQHRRTENISLFLTKYNYVGFGESLCSGEVGGARSSFFF